MKKDKAINLIKNNLGLNLNLNNTNWSNINANGIWSMEPNIKRENDTLFQILNNNLSQNLHVFKLSPKNEVYAKLYKRNDKPVFRLLFDVDDLNFIETLKNINFKKYHIGSIKY